MTKKYKNIFFDLDGTISDSYKGIENGIHFALEKMGVNVISPDDIKDIIGIPLTQSLKNYFSNNPEKITEAVAYFREYYALKGLFESELYPNIYELLAWSSDFYDLYIITAKPTVYATQLLEFHNVSKFFSDIKGCQFNEVSFKKSDLMRSVSNYSNSLIVGDKKQDIEAGKEIGIKTCGVLYGYGTEKEIKESNPDFIAASTIELREILSF
jgi:phosphoglycolate phosphatase